MESRPKFQGKMEHRNVHYYCEKDHQFTVQLKCDQFVQIMLHGYKNLKNISKERRWVLKYSLPVSTTDISFFFELAKNRIFSIEQ